MFAGRVACCPLVSYGNYHETDMNYAGGIDRHMDRRQTVTLRFPRDAASVKIRLLQVLNAWDCEPNAWDSVHNYMKAEETSPRRRMVFVSRQYPKIILPSVRTCSELQTDRHLSRNLTQWTVRYIVYCFNVERSAVYVCLHAKLPGIYSRSVWTTEL